MRYGTEVTVTLPPGRIMEALPRLAEPGEQEPEEKSKTQALWEKRAS
ncbi:hypothetical protein [Methyloceanibacter sp. wino2]|nr:hypothetical protein [Methyloceanibacter sp. wino2]